nr:MucBP domain-containing protein [Paenibacillus phocaensis]
MSVFGATSSGDPVWPNPGATQLSKTAKPTGNPGEWEITLKVEGKNLKTSSDVVLVIDKSGSMNDKVNKQKKMDKAKEAANKFVDNLLLNGADTQIAVVAFNRTSELVSSFKGPNQKAALKAAINGIKADGGTNIQAGIKQAHELLSSNQSQAKNKIIVLLSDGEPTYSYKGIAATNYSWSNNGYDSSYPFAITAFDYDNIVGSGSSYKVDYGFGEWIRDSWFSGHYQYEVKDNGIGTFSEAKLAKEAGHKLFSVGLDVEKNSNAEKVLKNIKSEGYYSASNDDLNKIFREMAGKISFAAQDAKVIDPMGDMFNLKMQGKQISVQDYTVSQGKVDWDPVTEKYIWNIGNIAEGEPAVFTYKVVMDPSKNPVSNTLYPTNGKTTLEYKDVNNRNTSKDFEVPKVSIGNGSILMKGYKVNADGHPVNAEGIEVEGPEFAEVLYSEYYKDQTGNEALPIGSKEYSVPAKEVASYQLKVGENPTKVRLTATNPTPVIWFGYEEVVDRTVTVKFLEKGTEEELAKPKTFTGKIGETLNLEAVDVTDYTPVNATAQYTVKPEGNEYIFYYTSNERTVTVKFLEKGTEEELAEPVTVSGKIGETLKLEAVDVTDYTPENATAQYTVKPEGNEYIFYYTSNERVVTVKFLEKDTKKKLAEPVTVSGKIGETLKLEAVDVTDYTPVNATAQYTVKAEDNEYIFYYTSNERTVTVKFLEKDTKKKLAEPVTVSGKIGETLNLEAVNVTDYTPENATAQYTVKAEDNEYIFYYTSNERVVTVKFLEKDTKKKLAEPVTVSGRIGETLKLEAVDVTDYTPVNATAQYTVKAEDNEYIFYYTSNERTVTVKFLENDTKKKLAEPVTVSGKIGETLKLEAVDVTDYTPVNATAQYTVKAEDNEYIFYYTSNERTVTVKFLEKDTKKKLAEPVTVSGKIGETLNLEAVDVTDYTPENTTAQYTVKAEDNEYIFYYTSNERTVTVKFLEKDTKKKLAEPVTVSGKIGETLKLEAVDVTDYTPVNATAQYTVKAEDNEYIFYYTSNERTVTVKFLEKDTEKELASPQPIKGMIGDTLDLEAVDVTDYTPVNATAQYTVKADGNNEYTFYYTSNERTVTVKFLEKGTEEELAKPKTFTGKIGETLNLEAVDVTDYTPENATAQYTVKAEDNEYIFYYTANSTEPDDNRTVTVRYVDKDTQKDLKPSQPHTGKVGEVITLTATDYKDSVTGVVYQPHTYEVPYTFTEDQVQQFVFEYTQDKSNLERSVTIHHVDLESNEELIAPTTELGYAGRTLVLYPEPISVTDAVYYPEQLEYGFEITLDSVQEFTIYYTKGEPTDLAQLTVSYLDRETGAELAAPEMIKGRIGDKIELTAKEVLGYTPETVKYTHEFIDDPNQAHVFYYTKNAPADRQLTVKYLENGTNRQLASPTVVTGKPGETKTLAALSVSGYTPVKSTDTYTFNDKEGQEFIFYYTRNSSNPGGSDNSGDSGNSGNSGDSGNPTPPSTPEVTPLPPLPAVPPTLDTENHFQYIHGYPDGSVKPLNNITREEVATIFYRLLDDESRSAYLKTGTDLSDVEAKRWSNPFISTMENAGIVTGYPNGTFKPGQFITRAEFAAIASRFDKLDERPNDMFTDIKGHWAEKYIASAANKGWINGYTDGTFKPDQYITRAEAAKFINSVLNRKVDEAGLHEDAKMWPDNAKGMWYYYEILEATNHHDYSREDSDVEVWNEVKPNRVYP